MSLFTILYNILIGPLELVFEIIYAIAYRFIGDPGLAIIVLSLIMNLTNYLRCDIVNRVLYENEVWDMVKRRSTF